MRKVLIIDDNEVNLYLMKEMLNLKNYHVDCATNGYEGINLFKKKDFDSVLVDITMPVMNGLEVLKELKKYNKPTKFIAVTANAFNEQIKKYLDAGFDNVIVKPIIMNDLFEKVES